MSVTITTAQVQQYRRNVQIKYQTSGMLRPYVRVENTDAKYHYFDLLAPTAAVKNIGRHADTPLVNSQHERRRAEMDDYDWADLIDQQDRVRMIIEPEGSYVTNATNAMGRSEDEIIIDAFDAVAFEGETGTTQVAFNAADFSIGGAGIPMTVDLLRQTKRIMDDADIPSSDRHMALRPRALEQLLGTTQATSIDFNTVRTLVRGEIDTFLGFKFHMISPNVLNKSEAAGRANAYAWHKRAMGLATGKSVSVDIGPRRDKRNSQQVYVCMVAGGVRIEDGVVRLDIDEA